MSIDDFDDNVIMNLCQSMDDRTLSKFVTTTHRVHLLCQKILDERKPKNPFPGEEINSVLLTPIKPVSSKTLKKQMNAVGEYMVSSGGGYDIVIFNGGLAISFRHQDDETEARKYVEDGEKVTINKITYEIKWNILV